MPNAAGLSGGGVQSGRPRSCTTGIPSPSGAVAGVADGKEVAQSIECALNWILDAERL
jgi:hypothetical protein